jgi:acyl-CoA thioesterase I
VLIGPQGAAAAAPARTILVFGDSLSAAYGLAADQGWVALLQRRLQSQGYGYAIVNASISGETTSGGLQRLPRALRLHRPAIVVLELGANDGLRGLPIDAIRDRLAEMIRLAEREGARVLLLGIRLPPNYGPRYGDPFAAMYGQLAAEFHIPLVPFLLVRVGLVPSLMQADGLHPNAEGEGPVLATVWPYLAPLLQGRSAQH